MRHIIFHPYAPGAVGTAHGSDYYIDDPQLACVGSAKWQLCMLYTLLGDNAKTAKQIVADFEPQFKTKEEFFAYVDSLSCSGDRINYNGKEAVVKL